MKHNIIKVLKTAMWFVIGMPLVDYVMTRFFGIGTFVFEGNGNEIVQRFVIFTLIGIMSGISKLYRVKKIDKQ